MAGRRGGGPGGWSGAEFGLGSADLDAAGLGLGHDGDRDHQDAVGVVGGQRLGVEVLGQDQRAGDAAVAALRADDLGALGGGEGSLGGQGQFALFDREVDAGRVDIFGLKQFFP